MGMRWNPGETEMPPVLEALLKIPERSFIFMGLG
jgi:hypothetical protein